MEFNSAFKALMATCFGFADHHLAIVQKINLRYMQCDYVEWDHIKFTIYP
jgi:hypothetical protein